MKKYSVLVALLAISAFVCGLNPGSVRADAIDEYLGEIQKELQIPGLVLAIVENNQISLMRTKGHASLEFSVPAHKDTVFELASLTKQFTAAAIMLLVERGKLGLDDKITQHIPEKYEALVPPAWKEIAVRHLLTHTGGLEHRFERRLSGVWLMDYATDDLFNSAAQRAEDIDFAPGDHAHYSDQGYFLLGVIIEGVSGKSYGEFLEEEFFDKLGMNDTRLVDRNRVEPRLAQAYTWDDQNCLRIRDRFRDVRETLTSHYGVISKVSDLVKWDAELNKPTILKQDSLKKMWTPAKLNDGRVATPIGDYQYGFGWVVDKLGERDVVDHSGRTGTYYMRIPEEQFALIFLTNWSYLSYSTLRGIGREIVALYKPGLLGSTVESHESGKVHKAAQNLETCEAAR